MDGGGLNMDDCISRQAAIDACLKGKTDGLPATNVACDCCAERIRVLPSAQPERETGKWIKVKPISGVEAYMCPFCKTGDWDISVDSYNYCPYCGKSVSGVADDPSHPFVDDVMMEGEEDE